MRRYSTSPYGSSYSFGPGPVGPAIKALLIGNIGLFVAGVVPSVNNVLQFLFGLRPEVVIGRVWIWQLATYMFLHASLFHIIFNMLALWMFGTELERIWGTRYFLKFYLVTGVGAAALTVAFSFLPFGFATALRYATIIGASGAIYGLLLAYAMYFPDRPILLYFFPVPAKYCVMILGAISLYYSVGESGGVANITHLGGLLVGYLFLKGAYAHPLSELKYRYLKWKINRVRRKFDVYSGGRADDWDRKIH